MKDFLSSAETHYKFLDLKIFHVFQSVAINGFLMLTEVSGSDLELSLISENFLILGTIRDSRLILHPLCLRLKISQVSKEPQFLFAGAPVHAVLGGGAADPVFTGSVTSELELFTSLPSG